MVMVVPQLGMQGRVDRVVWCGVARCGAMRRGVAWRPAARWGVAWAGVVWWGIVDTGRGWTDEAYNAAWRGAAWRK